MNKTLARYLVWVRNHEEDSLTPVYVTALSAKEAAHIVEASIWDDLEEIDSVYKEVKFK